jgi:hypothetical protein
MQGTRSRNAFRTPGKRQSRIRGRGLPQRSLHRKELREQKFLCHLSSQDRGETLQDRRVSVQHFLESVQSFSHIDGEVFHKFPPNFY